MISMASQRNSAMGLVAPENRLKFKGQVEPGFGLYLDAYINAPTNSAGKRNSYYFGPENGSRLSHFERNLSEALECAGEYVWLWGEKKSFVKWGGPGYFHVIDDTAIPGQHYVVEASGTGEGLSGIAFWQQRKDNHSFLAKHGIYWRWRLPGHGFAFKRGADGRYSAREVIRVPEGVDCLAIQFRLHPPKGKECLFDKIFVGRIP